MLLKSRHGMCGVGGIAGRLSNLLGVCVCVCVWQGAEGERGGGEHNGGGMWQLNPQHVEAS